MKIGLDIGHNSYPDIGAQGIGDEDRMNSEIGNLLSQKLINKNIDVISCLPKTVNSVPASLRKRAEIANYSGCDYFVSIHHNAFNGKAYGSEVYAISSTGWKLAESILAKIVRLGFHNRGVKNGKHLYVLSATKMPAVLIEGCFLDSQKDMQLWNAEKMADAIFSGICKFLDI